MINKVALIVYIDDLSIIRKNQKNIFHIKKFLK